MTFTIRLTRRFALVVVAAILVAAAGSIGYAAIPDSDGQLHVCFKTSDAAKNGGAALSVIDPADGGACGNNQTQISLTDQELVTGQAFGPGFFATGLTPFGSSIEVTTNRATKLFLIGNVEVQVTCEAGETCSRHFQVFVDEEPVATMGGGAAGSDSSPETREFTRFSVVDVAAGTHTIQWRAKSSGLVRTSSNAMRLGALVLGG